LPFNTQHFSPPTQKEDKAAENDSDLCASVSVMEIPISSLSVIDRVEKKQKRTLSALKVLLTVTILHNSLPNKELNRWYFSTPGCIYSFLGVIKG